MGTAVGTSADYTVADTPADSGIDVDTFVDSETVADYNILGYQDTVDYYLTGCSCYFLLSIVMFIISI